MRTERMALSSLPPPLSLPACLPSLEYWELSHERLCCAVWGFAVGGLRPSGEPLPFLPEQPCSAGPLWGPWRGRGAVEGSWGRGGHHPSAVRILEGEYGFCPLRLSQGKRPGGRVPAEAKANVDPAILVLALLGAIWAIGWDEGSGPHPLPSASSRGAVSEGAHPQRSRAREETRTRARGVCDLEFRRPRGT